MGKTRFKESFVYGNGLGVITPGGGEIPIVSPSGSMLPFGAVGATYFVDADNGADTNDGMSWDTAFATMSKAFSVVKSGEKIYLRGLLQEEVTTPQGITGVTIIGANTTPRVGAATAGPKIGAATWAHIAVPAAPVLTVTQQGWRVSNIAFSGVSGYTAILLKRDAGVGVDEKNAGYFSAVGCVFIGGLGGVWDDGGNEGVWLIDCEFRGLAEATSFAVKTVSTTVAAPKFWRIVGCVFEDNKNHISLESVEGLVDGCKLFAKGGTVTTVIKLKLRASLGARNQVTGCVLGGDYRTNNDEYVAGTDDEWFGNHVGLVNAVARATGTTNALPVATV